ncbi:MAG: division/cell wall cluster transcriptional repressor MraZ [Oscillospiraceae bacterium]|nr:division/cell wall cluster transcriptional repressor MraZ [Oscillospiraceae bacterium]
MTGEYRHTIDAKGRVSVPSRLREKLGSQFYVTIGLDRCLAVYSQSRWDEFAEKFASQPYAKARHMRPIFANACCCELDAQGRILLPQKLREYAGLKKEVTIIGVYTHAEIWDTAARAAAEETELAPENIERVMEELGI